MHELFTKLYDEFQAKYSHIKLEVLEDQHETWTTKIKTMMASKDVTEVFITQPGDFTVFRNSGIYYDFTDALNSGSEWKNSLYEDAFASWTVDGRIYGIPLEGYVEGIYCNMELFRKYNVEIPKTFEELKNVVKVFAQNGVASFAVGAKDGWPIVMITNYLMDREAGLDFFVKSISNKEMTWNNEEYLNANKKFLELVNLGAFSKGVAAHSYGDALAQFIRGEAAMMVNGTWAIPSMLADPEFSQKEIVFVNFPSN